MTELKIPHLQIADNSPCNMVEKLCLQKKNIIEAWFREKWIDSMVPLTSSIDIRNAGFKLSAIDTNLFPAGFNNLNTDFLPLCVQAMQYTIARQYPKCQRVLIIPEEHSRNSYYFDSLWRLNQILQLAGYDTLIGQITADSQITKIRSSFGDLEIHPLTRKKNIIHIHDFIPCMILLNRDLSEGIPEMLKGISQVITPPVKLGWTQRSKNRHFIYYNKICQEFANILQIDPWLISPIFTECSNLDFMAKDGLDRLCHSVAKIIEQVQEKYKKYDITYDPFVAIKADSGTYGMNVMMVKDPKDILSLNRKARTKMSYGKGKQVVTKVIIQEGIYSFETWKGAVAEPVVYLIGSSVVGGFYRIHKNKGISDNLNSPGMEFKTLAFNKACNTPYGNDYNKGHPNRFYIFGVIARLALLAAMQEIEES